VREKASRLEYQELIVFEIETETVTELVIESQTGTGTGIRIFPKSVREQQHSTMLLTVSTPGTGIELNG